MEGFIPVAGGRIWYQVLGGGGGLPLILLHGGPGFPHDYLEPLGALSDERPVVFYDQLGCGRSDRPADTALWRIERFVEELAQLRAALRLDRVHIFGHSWGAMVATDYVLSGASGVAGLILASPPLSIPRWIEDARRLRASLPAEVQAILARHEAAGTLEAEEYQAATREYYARFVRRLDPVPEALNQARAGMGTAVYEYMWGPNEFHVTGTLADYDRTDRLGEIRTPTLLTCGRYDEATPEATAFYQRLIPRAEMVVFEESAHLPHLGEAERYVQVVRDFLRRVEPNRAR